METIEFEVKSILKCKLEMTSFPLLTSKKKWINKGLIVLKKSTPSLLNYFSKQHVLEQLPTYKIKLHSHENHEEKSLRLIFKKWLKKEKWKRLILVIILGIILPVTPILALLPGPNIFFYIPALLFYFYLKTYRGLRKTNADQLDITVIESIET